MQLPDFLRHKPERLAGMAIALAIVLFAAFNLSMGMLFRDARIDLTQDRLYTLSESTKKVLARVPEPIVITIYASQPLLDSAPRLRTYAERIEEMLRTYRVLSGGKVRYQRINPTPFSAEEDRAIGLQMRGFMMNSTGEQGYFGLTATNTTDGFEKIEFLDPQSEENLEYEMSSLIDRLSRPERRKIGIIDGMNMFGSREFNRPPFALLEMINKNYSVAEILTPPINFAGIDALMVAHPHHLPPAVLYAIDQHVMAGKPTFFLVDPLAETTPPSSRNPAVPEVPSSDPGGMFKAWGIEFDNARVVGDRSMALRVTAQSGRQRVVASYLPWLQVKKENFNSNDPATSQLQLMRMTSAGALRVAKDGPLRMTPLIMSTPDSMLFANQDVMGRPNPNDLMERFKPAGERFVLAARFAGNVKSAYPDGPPVPEDQRAKPVLPHVGQSAAPLNLVVVADVDLLSNSHVMSQRGTPITSNGDFVLNVLDSLVGGLDLNGLRGRGMLSRSFKTIEKMESEAEDRYRATELKLSQQLEETQAQVAQLQTRNAPAEATDVPVMSREQQDAIGKFNRQIVEIRRQLRDVRAAGRSQIEALELNLKVLNILLVPAVLTGLALLLWAYRRMRLKRHLASLRLHGGRA